MSTPIEEALRMEMDYSIPDDQLPSRTSVMRRRMRSGEMFTSDTFGTDDKSRSLMTVTITVLRRLGYEIKQEPYSEDGLQHMRYWVLNGEHFPTEEQIAANRNYGKQAMQRSAQKRKDDREAAALKNLCELCDPPTPHNSKDALRKHTARVHPKDERLPAKPKTNGVVPQITIGAMPPGVPGLGAGLQVFLLHLDEQGEINVGFRDGNGGQFMAQMVGTVGS